MELERAVGREAAAQGGEVEVVRLQQALGERRGEPAPAHVVVEKAVDAAETRVERRGGGAEKEVELGLGEVESAREAGPDQVRLAGTVVAQLGLDALDAGERIGAALDSDAAGELVEHRLTVLLRQEEAEEAFLPGLAAQRPRQGHLVLQPQCQHGERLLEIFVGAERRRGGVGRGHAVHCSALPDLDAQACAPCLRQPSGPAVQAGKAQDDAERQRVEHQRELALADVQRARPSQKLPTQIS